ncbi:woronin body major protein [Polytolypa hystricis UAMH7299]|uniref:Woronin body major protein n=1 Tax=Polytolypa hystricis (strain UAMH7299) TaxID=1447883 RepID=A0A2B7WP79_POLH7|nr:woronin body major protein [Polytolypa hystricis UAMH7299]
MFTVTSHIGQHSRKDVYSSAVNLDFDARVPIPFSVFPSSYRSDAVVSADTTHTRVEGEVKLAGSSAAAAASRVGREDTHYEGLPPPPPRSSASTYSSSRKEDVDVDIDVHHHYHSSDPRHHQRSSHSHHESHEEQPRRYPEVDLSRDRYYESSDRKAFETQLDITEREYRRRTDPIYEAEYSRTTSYPREIDTSYSQQLDTSIDTRGPIRNPSEIDIDAVSSSKYRSADVDINVDRRTVIEAPSTATTSRKMGYYDDEGQYHSFRRGVERAADRLMHPFSSHKEEVVSSDEHGPSRVREGVRESVRVVKPRGGHPAETITIPCHFIRMGDLLILQGRPCQVIRISVSPQTGQHRYLGVDLFTRQLHEESSFISHPSPSVVVQSMLGPVYMTYRILDLRDDGRIVAMTESGDVKHGIKVVDQGNLFNRLSSAFNEGRGSVRALVINDGGRELVVDYKVIHGSRL